MNKIITLTFALLFSVFSWAQNDTIKNYYDEQKKSSQDGDVKDYYPNDSQQQSQPPQQQAQPYYPSQNQQQQNNNPNRNIVNKTPIVPESEFMKRLYFGTNLGLQFYSYGGYNVFAYDVSPFAGIKINEYFSAGLQIVYDNSIYFTHSQNVSYSIVGGGLFVRAVVFKHLLLALEYDVLTEPASSVFGNRTVSGEKMAGVGYKSRIANIHSKKTGTDKPLSYFFCLMYDFAPDINSPYYNNKVVYRLGFAYNW